MNAPKSLRAAPLAMWIAVQLGALALGAWQAPLARLFTQPAQRAALDEMAVIQIAVASVAFTMLTADLFTTLATIAIAWPMLQLAGFIAAAPAGAVIAAGLYISAWIVGLGLMARAAKTEAARMTLVAILAAWSLGGAAFWYLQLEFHSPSIGSAAWGPILGALSVERDPFNVVAWITPLVLGVVAIIMTWIPKPADRTTC